MTEFSSLWLNFCVAVGKSVIRAELDESPFDQDCADYLLLVSEFARSEWQY